MASKLLCPECFSDRVVKDGFSQFWVKGGSVRRHKVKVQKYRCNLCGRSFREKKK